MAFCIGSGIAGVSVTRFPTTGGCWAVVGGWMPPPRADVGRRSAAGCSAIDGCWAVVGDWMPATCGCWAAVGGWMPHHGRMLGGCRRLDAPPRADAGRRSAAGCSAIGGCWAAVSGWMLRHRRMLGGGQRLDAPPWADTGRRSAAGIRRAQRRIRHSLPILQSGGSAILFAYATLPFSCPEFVQVSQREL